MQEIEFALKGQGQAMRNASKMSKEQKKNPATALERFKLIHFTYIIPLASQNHVGWAP